MIATGLAWLIRFRILTVNGLVFQTQVAYLIPIFGVFFGYFLMNEIITWRVIVSLIIILLGIYIVKKNKNNLVVGNFINNANDDNHKLSTLPLLGKIAAGTPIEAIQQNDTSVDVPKEMMPIGESYALTVEGDSMINEGIHNGDTVLIKKTNIADNGEIVVALIDDNEATLKRIRKKGQSIALESANPIYETRILSAHRVKIQGKLIGLLRKY